MSDQATSYVQERIRKVADGLRDQAAEIERQIERVPRDAPQAVAAVIHTVMWGTANAHLDVLVSAADRIRQFREAEAAEGASS